MIPCRKFYLDCRCPVHGNCFHEIIFMNYDPKTQLVSFVAFCLECDVDMEGKKRLGFKSVLPANDWNKITPLEYEFKFN